MLSWLCCNFTFSEILPRSSICSSNDTHLIHTLILYGLTRESFPFCPTGHNSPIMNMQRLWPATDVSRTNSVESIRETNINLSFAPEGNVILLFYWAVLMAETDFISLLNLTEISIYIIY